MVAGCFALLSVVSTVGWITINVPSQALPLPAAIKKAIKANTTPQPKQISSVPSPGMPPGAYIIHPAPDGNSLREQVAALPFVLKRYMNTWHLSKQDTLAEFTDLELAKLPQDRILRVYYTRHSTGQWGFRVRKVPKGTPIFQRPTGEPVLIQACGNPISDAPAPSAETLGIKPGSGSPSSPADSGQDGGPVSAIPGRPVLPGGGGLDVSAPNFSATESDSAPLIGETTPPPNFPSRKRAINVGAAGGGLVGQAGDSAIGNSVSLPSGGGAPSSGSAKATARQLRRGGTPVGVPAPTNSSTEPTQSNLYYIISDKTESGTDSAGQQSGPNNGGTTTGGSTTGGNGPTDGQLIDHLDNQPALSGPEPPVGLLLVCFLGIVYAVRKWLLRHE